MPEPTGGSSGEPAPSVNPSNVPDSVAELANSTADDDEEEEMEATFDEIDQAGVDDGKVETPAASTNIDEENESINNHGLEEENDEDEEEEATFDDVVEVEKSPAPKEASSVEETKNEMEEHATETAAGDSAPSENPPKDTSPEQDQDKQPTGIPTEIEGSPVDVLGSEKEETNSKSPSESGDLENDADTALNNEQ